MRNAVGCVVAAMAMLSGAPAAVAAQSVFGGVGIASTWDDETMLGRGASLSGGVAKSVGRHLSVEGELAWARQLRDAGYLAAEGTPLSAVARINGLFARPESKARAFASVGAGVVHSTGTLTTRTTVIGPGGLPADGPAVRRDWSLTKPAFEVGAGAAIAAGSRLRLRPEVRWISTLGTTAANVGIEPPVWIIRAGVVAEWRLGRRED